MSEEQGHAMQNDTGVQNIREWQHALIDLLLRSMVLVALPVLLIGIYYALERDMAGAIPLYLGAYAVLLGARLVKGVSYAVKAGVMLALFYGLAIVFFLQAGLSGDGRVFLVAFCFAAVILLGQRMGYVALGIAALSLLTLGVLYTTGVLSIAVERQATTTRASAWISNTVTLGLVLIFISASTEYLLRHFLAALGEARALTEALETGRQQAEAESRHTQQQADRVRWAAAFGSTVISIRRRDELMLRLVRELAQTFDLYAVNLFLKAERGDVLTLGAAAGERSAVLMQSHWELPVGGHLLPARVAQIGTEQAAFISSGELPEFPRTRVEVALPLVTRGELLGVLDIHATRAAFSDDDLQLFRVVADYATTSLDVLRLLEESDRQMEEMRALYAQYTTASWRSVLETEATEAYSVGDLDAASVQELALEAMQAAAPRAASLAQDGYLLVVPLIARDLSLGYLAFRRSARRGDWDAGTRALIETAAERLALALDNTRLLIEARQQALYEEQLGHIGDVVWSNPSVEIIMERSVKELGQFLGASEVALYFTPTDEAQEVRE